MKDKIPFIKMVASGNDFIVMEKIRPSTELVSMLCSRHTGIGADGVLILEPSKKADFKMRIFNSDGSEAEMCGNGARCISLYAWKHKLINKRFTIETLAGIIKAQIVPPDKITIFLCEPTDMKLNLVYRDMKIHYINTGVPHAIIYFSNIDDIDVANLGKRIRWSKLFQPKGANVDFVQIRGKDHISVRTYERGVEGETLACGTGVTASAIISNKLKKLAQKIKISTKSGDLLEVDTEKISLTGPANFVFEGRILK